MKLKTLLYFMESPIKTELSPDFSLPKNQQAFVQDANDAVSLLKKEILVNQAEQNLLGQRIRLMKEFVSDLPSSDPQYSMLLTQIQMDQIELDELKRREHSISDQIMNFSNYKE